MQSVQHALPYRVDPHHFSGISIADICSLLWLLDDQIKMFLRLEAVPGLLFPLLKADGNLATDIVSSCS